MQAGTGSTALWPFALPVGGACVGDQERSEQGWGRALNRWDDSAYPAPAGTLRACFRVQDPYAIISARADTTRAFTTRVATIAGDSPWRGIPLSDHITLATVGIALNIVGVIFLTNAMVVRKPRRFIQQYFGVERPQPLRTVLDQLNAKAQIFTGFVALLIGFSLQIAARINPPLASGDPVAGDGLTERLTALGVLALGILAVTVLLRFGQNAWSVANMRRMLAEFFHEHDDWNFEKHPNQTREIGELLGVSSREDDSIGDYAARVRDGLRLNSGERTNLGRDDAFAPLRNVGADRRN